MGGVLPRAQSLGVTVPGYCRLAHAGDAEALAPRLRHADREEIAARSGSAPLTALLHGVLYSRPCYAIVGPTQECEGLFGVVPDSTTDLAGSVWLLGSDALVTPPLSTRFLRESRRWLATLHETYPLLWNVIDERNAAHLAWLKWLGFRVIRRYQQFGVANRPFLEFVRLNS